MVTLTTRRMSSDQELPSAELSGGRPAAAGLSLLAESTAKELVQLFKLLADETRLRILYFLMQQDELNVRTLCKLLRQSQPAVSHHLALLRVAGVIECRRDGKHNFYHLVPKRCQAYLDTIFGGAGDQARRVRVEDAVVTYQRDGQGS
jgi:ArsR family transcriptional regulator